MNAFSYLLQDEELYWLFSNINNLGSSVEAVRVIRDPHTSVGKGIAYVLFKTRVSFLCYSVLADIVSQFLPIII